MTDADPATPSPKAYVKLLKFYRNKGLSWLIRGRSQLLCKGRPKVWKDVTGGAGRENVTELLSHEYCRDSEGIIRQ